MSFIWNPTPNTPQPIIEDPIPSVAVSSKVGVVANTVDWGGRLKWNTSGRQYETIYEFDSLLVNVGNFTIATTLNASINNLSTITFAANVVTIQTGNIGNAQITFGTVLNIPNNNSSVVNKAYVDNAIASISGGSGPDTTANIFLAKGDLLVGVSPNVATRLPVGSNGQILTVDTTSTIKVAWKDSTAKTQDIADLSIGAHYDPRRSATTILLKRSNFLNMDTGERVSNWSNITANLMLSGAGGLDSLSSLTANTWYEVWAIYNPTSGDKNLLLHRMPRRVVDQNWFFSPPVFGQFITGSAILRQQSIGLGAQNQNGVTKISQGFVPFMTAPIYAVDLLLGATLTNVGNCWVTIEPDDGTGNASGSIVATSRSFNFESWDGITSTAHFIFDTTSTLTAGARYHIVLQGDRPMNTDPNNQQANSIIVYGNTRTPGANQFAWSHSLGYNGEPGSPNTAGFGQARSYNVVSSSWTVSANLTIFATAPVPSDLFFRTYMIDQASSDPSLPTGYTQKSLISYACTNAASRLKFYTQVNQTITTGFDSEWRTWSPVWVQSQSFQIGEFVDISTTIPPISCLCEFLVWIDGTVENLSTISEFDINPNIFALEARGAGFERTRTGIYSIAQANGERTRLMPIPAMNMEEIQGFVSFLNGNGVSVFISSITF